MMGLMKVVARVASDTGGEGAMMVAVRAIRMTRAVSVISVIRGAESGGDGDNDDKVGASENGDMG